MKHSAILTLLCVGCGSSAEPNKSDGFRHVAGPSDDFLRSGSVLLTQDSNPKAPFHQILGVVQEKPRVNNCHLLTEGACSVRTCDNDLDLRGQSKSAGTLTVTVAGTQHDVPFTTAGRYQMGGAGLLWQAPGPIGISASGGDMPAFTETLNAPGPMSMTSAFVGAGSRMGAAKNPVPRGEPFAFAWTGGWQGDKILAELAWGKRHDGRDYVAELQCLFDVTLGTASLPAELLKLMPLSDAGSNAVLTFYTTDRKTAQLGNDYHASLRALSYGVSVEGEQAVYPAEILP